ncbi:MAG: hypothetical protein ABI047_14875 [Jatrophihabitantaceae bacterium]
MSWLTEPDEDWDQREAPPRNRLKLAASVLAGWLAVSLIVLVGLLTFGGHRSSNKPSNAPPASLSTAAASTTAAGSTAASSAAAGSPSSSATGQAPAGWLLRGSDDQSNCAAHSYGQVQVFFARTPCSSVRRSLFSMEQDGRSVVVAASAVTFDSPERAAGYLALVTSDGTGNVNDLLREGTRYPGSPSKLPPAAFASRQDGVRVLVAEAAFVQGSSGYQDATLQAAARRAVDTG